MIFLTKISTERQYTFQFVCVRYAALEARVSNRDAQDSWVLGLGTPKVLGFLRFWVWVLGFKFWVVILH